MRVLLADLARLVGEIIITEILLQGFRNKLVFYSHLAISYCELMQTDLRTYLMKDAHVE